MGGYQLPALHVNPPQPSEGPLDAYGKLLQYKNLGLQNQAHQQAVQAGQLEIQQKQRALQDQNTIMEAQAAAQGDPKKWLPAIQGKVSPQTFMSLTKTDAETRDQLAKADASELAVMKDKNDRFVALLNQAKSLPPDQYAQSWPQILQSAEEIHPGSIQKLGLNPQQPIPQEKLGLFSIGLQTQEQYIKQAQEDRAKQKAPFEQQKAEADAATAQSEAQIKGAEAKAMQQYGGLSPEMQKSRYLSIQTKLNSGAKISPDDQAFKKAYEDEKRIVPAFNFNLQNSGTTGNAADVAKRFGMTPASFDQAAEKYWTSGQLPPAGRGGPALALNKAIMNRTAELHPDGSLAANSAEFKANQSSLSSIQKQFDAVSAFEGTANRNIERLKKVVQDIPDLGMRFADVPARMISDKLIGTQAMARFKVDLQTVQSESAKILNSSNATGVLSDSARHELQSIVDGSAPIPAIMASVEELQRDFANRHESYSQQIADIKGRMKSTPSAAPNNTQQNNSIAPPDSTSDPFAAFGGKKLK